LDPSGRISVNIEAHMAHEKTKRYSNVNLHLPRVFLAASDARLSTVLYGCKQQNVKKWRKPRVFHRFFRLQFCAGTLQAAGRLNKIMIFARRIYARYMQKH
jgi:hypothetical protein